MYLRARYYDPAIGVFTALDPFEGTMQRPMSMNGYSWVEGNTPNMVDPTGYCGIQVGACGLSLLNIVDNAAVIGFGIDLAACSWAAACVGGTYALYTAIQMGLGQTLADLYADVMNPPVSE